MGDKGKDEGEGGDREMGAQRLEKGGRTWEEVGELGDGEAGMKAGEAGLGELSTW